MNHALILSFIVAAAFLVAFFHILKNKPQYLVLLGIRGLFSVCFIQFVNWIFSQISFPSILQANPLCITAGAFLGIPGILLLYISKIYLL